MHTQTHAHTNTCTHTPGLKPDWVIRVTFGPGQAGLIQFVKYLGLTWILHCDQRNELSVLDGDSGSISSQKISKLVIADKCFKEKSERK